MDPMIELLRGGGVEVDVFDGIEPDPTFEIVLEGIERIRRLKAVSKTGGKSKLTLPQTACS